MFPTSLMDARVKRQPRARRGAPDAGDLRRAPWLGGVHVAPIVLDGRLAQRFGGCDGDCGGALGACADDHTRGLAFQGEDLDGTQHVGGA